MNDKTLEMKRKYYGAWIGVVIISITFVLFLFGKAIINKDLVHVSVGVFMIGIPVSAIISEVERDREKIRRDLCQHL